LRDGIGEQRLLHPDDFRGGYCTAVCGNLAGISGIAEPTDERFKFKFIFELLGQHASQIVESAQLRALEECSVAAVAR